MGVATSSASEGNDKVGGNLSPGTAHISVGYRRSGGSIARLLDRSRQRLHSTMQPKPVVETHMTKSRLIKRNLGNACKMKRLRAVRAICPPARVAAIRRRSSAGTSPAPAPSHHSLLRALGTPRSASHPGEGPG